MRELSVFADESGDASHQSKYYLLTLIFHDQSHDLTSHIKRHEQALESAGLPDIPFHLSPLMNGHGSYESLDLSTRKNLLVRFITFAKMLPLRYKVFVYPKSQVEPERLFVKLKQDLINYLFDNLEFFQEFDVVKIYYDNGQKLITQSIKAAIEYVIASNAALFKDADPTYYRLSQAADLYCGMELLALKFDASEQTNTDEIFFINKGAFKKNYLRHLRAKLL